MTELQVGKNIPGWMDQGVLGRIEKGIGKIRIMIFFLYIAMYNAKDDTYQWGSSISDKITYRSAFVV